jgi:hypothetical protein
MEKPLTKSEREEFQKHDAIVGEGLLYAFVAGRSLTIIQERQLYREEYDTFEDYCLERRDISRRRAYQLIDASRMRGELEDQGVKILPENEYQVRELKRLPTPKDRAEAWEDARQMCTERTQIPPHSFVKRAVEAKLYELRPATKNDEPVPQTTKPEPVEARPFESQLISEDATIEHFPRPRELPPAPIQHAPKGDVVLDHIQCPVCHSIYKFLEEYMVAAEEAPQNARPNGKEQNFIRGQLEQYFSKISNIPVPMPKTEKQKGQVRTRWWNPLREIAELADWNQQRAEDLMARSYKHLNGNGIFVEAPQTLIKTIRAMAAGQMPSQKSNRKKSGYELYKEMYVDE